MKTALICQPCGLGDILFLQKRALTLIQEGYEVYWPVVHEFEWLNDYIPQINFISWDDKDKKLTGPPLPDHVKFPYKDLYQYSTKTGHYGDCYFFQGFIDVHPIMAGKYMSVGMDWRDWRHWIKFNRNEKKENELYYDVLGLKDNEEFDFVNRKYGVRPEIYIASRIPIDSNVKTVELDIYPEFTLFDWFRVFENCKKINMIETSLNYIFESPQMYDIIKSKKELNLYSRHNNFNEVQYLFSLPWNYKFI